MPSEVKVWFWGAAATAAALLAFVAASLGDVLDHDTLSQILAWTLIRDGVTLEPWTIATPKPLLVAVDGLIWELGGFSAVSIRAVATFAMLVGLIAAFVAREWGGEGAAVASVLLLLNRGLLAQSLGGNSTIAFASLLAAAALLLPRRTGWGVAALFAATLARGEGALFLLLAAGALIALRRVKLALAAICLLLAAIGADSIVPTLVSGGARSNLSVTREITQAAVADARAAASPDFQQQHYLRIGTGYAETLASLLSRNLRPWPLYLLGCALGVWAWRSSGSRIGFWLTMSMGVLPLAYCWALDLMGFALFDRFLLPSVVAVTVLTAASLARMIAPASHRGLRLSAAALLCLALAVSGRDAWALYQGYWTDAAQTRQELRVALEPLRKGSSLLVSPAYWPYAPLAAEADLTRSARTDRAPVENWRYFIAAADDPRAGDLAKCAPPACSKLGESPSGAIRVYERTRDAR